MVSVSPRTRDQSRQRVKVGMVGLAGVLLLLLLASVILGSVSRERALLAPGGAKPDVVANLALANESLAATDMAISPGPQNAAAAGR